MKERTRQRQIRDAQATEREESIEHKKRWDNDCMRDATNSELNRMICHFEDTALSISSRQLVRSAGL